jgi:hypothetical protein
VVEAGVSRFERFWFTASEEIPILARLEPAMVMSAGVMTLLEASSRSPCAHLPRFLLQRETLDPLDRGDEVAFLRLSPPWGHRLGVDFAWGPRMEGVWPRLLARDAADCLATMMLQVEFGSRLELG